MELIKSKLSVGFMKPQIIHDSRGWFEIPFNFGDIHDLGFDFRALCQLNHSYTKIKDTMRGPNYQEKPFQFVTLEDDTELEYFTDEIYNFDSAKSIVWNDLDVVINWSLGGSIDLKEAIMSEKNKNAPRLKDIIKSIFTQENDE